MQMRRVALAIFSRSVSRNERERKRTLHHQLTEKSSVVEQGVVDVYYA